MSKRKRIIAEIVIDGKTTITVDGNKMSAEFGALDRGSLTDVVDWGIYANRGSISFIDKEGYFNNTNVNQFRLKNAKVVFYLANDEKTKIATFIVDDASYDEETRNVEIQLVSEISKWQSLKSPEAIFPYYATSVPNLVTSVGNMFDKEISSEGFPTKTTIYCPIFKKNETLWDIVTKICQATMSRVSEEPNGSAIITDSFVDRTPIVVLPKNIIGIPNKSFSIVENTSMEVTQREKKTESADLNFTINWSGYDYGSSSPIVTENVVLSHSGASMTFDEEYKKATVRGSAKIIGEAYTYSSLPSVSLSWQKQKFGQYATDIPSQFEQFAPGYLVEGFLGSKISANLRGEELVFRCDSLPIKQTEYDAATGKIRVSETVVARGTFSSTYSTFSDSKAKETRKINLSNDFVEIQSNDLVQERSNYDNQDVSLAESILEEVRNRYSKGIECFEIECLFNQYYNENNEVVFDGKDLSKHFRKYDIIIPYVVRNGVTEPLRVDENGDPKKFRIIGISYTDDGLLKQKLYVQEERYDID